MRATVAVCLLLVCGSWAPAETLEIGNSRLEVSYSSDTGEVALRQLSGAQPFAVLTMSRGTAQTGTAEIRPFGKAAAIAIRSAGVCEEILVPEELPFVLVRTTLRNQENTARVFPQVVTAPVRLALGQPAAALKVLGTGGLRAAAEAPGSYMWMAVADPETRHGVVAGWISTDRGSGVLLPRVVQEHLELQAQIDYGRLTLQPEQSQPLETLAIGYFDDARLGLEAYAAAIARRYEVHLPAQPCGYCTWYHAGASDEKHLAGQAEFAAEKLAPYGLSFLQIDDGWQEGDGKGNGPNKNFTQHRANGPYPSGMKATATTLSGLGLTAGLWFMPFAGTYNDPWFADKQAWFVHRGNGQPYDNAWGGTCLDMTCPEARDYLRSIVDRIAHDWGYRYFKMDGLWMGSATAQIYINDAYRPDGMGDAVFHDPEKTNIEIYRSGLGLIRETAGPEVFLLGCCGPQNMRSYGGAFGLIHAMRIGPDNGDNWKDLKTGPDYGSRNYFLHGRVWYNDPDPVYARVKVPQEQARVSCCWAAIAGQFTVASDDFATLPPDRLDLLRRVMPAHRATARPVDLFDEPLPRIWLVTDEHGSVRRDVIGLFNWSDAEATIDCPLARLGLSETRYLVFDYWANAALPTMEGHLRQTLPARSCRILAARPPADHPQVLSTSRHVTQGIVDLADERWDAAAGMLSGVSQVVGEDPYELRIALPNGGTPSGKVELGADDTAAGVTAATRRDGELLRVTLQTSQSRAIVWKIRFAQ